MTITDGDSDCVIFTFISQLKVLTTIAKLIVDTQSFAKRHNTALWLKGKHYNTMSWQSEDEKSKFLDTCDRDIDIIEANIEEVNEIMSQVKQILQDIELRPSEGVFDKVEQELENLLRDAKYREKESLTLLSHWNERFASLSSQGFKFSQEEALGQIRATFISQKTYLGGKIDELKSLQELAVQTLKEGFIFLGYFYR